jgi:hypothetical protein
MKILGSDIKFDLKKDKIIAIKKEELRVTEDGILYVYTHNDDEDEWVITYKYDVMEWAEKIGIDLD